MFHKSPFKVLTNLTLLIILCASQIAAVPNNNTVNVLSSDSTQPLISIAKFSQKTLGDPNTFTGSASTPEQVSFALIDGMDVALAFFHDAVLLNDGRVLGTGGTGISELYDPAASTWSTTGSMSVACAGTSTLLNDGKVLVTGGIGNPLVSCAELYDPSTGTWSATNAMNFPRFFHTATLLQSGKVLVTGGAGNSSPASIAELYDPSTGTWSITGATNNIHAGGHTTTLLNNGKVLVIGGDGNTTNSAELYDPDTGVWTTTGNTNVDRKYHTATLLNNGNVLATGGYFNLSNAELYDQATGIWSITGDMIVGRSAHEAMLLNNGKVLVTGGAGSTVFASTELYDPISGTWSAAGNMNVARAMHSAVLLNNGKVLITGGTSDGSTSLASSELVTLAPANTLNGTLTLPSGWLNSTSISVGFVGASSGAAINAGALSNDNNTWGGWVSASPDESIATTWDVGREGAGVPVYLRLRDINDQAATVVNGTVDVDLTSPSSILTSLPSISPAEISLSWSGSDSLSGISTYDVQVRAGPGSAWTNVVTNTTNTSITFNGSGGLAHYFRVRARDISGNVEDWPIMFDTYTLVDDTLPSAPGTNNFTGSTLLKDWVTFTTTGSMNAAHEYHTATLLNNGKVLVAGGYTISMSNLTSAELYDPDTGIWSPTGSMGVARSLHTATLLNDGSGRVLVAGGGASGASAELYDPATGTWSPTGSMGVTRAFHTATLLNNGKVLVAGGSGLASAELYDPATNTWSPTGEMSIVREFPTATLLNDGKVLIVGGNGNGSYLSSAELYDPAVGTWSPTGSMGIARNLHTAILLNNGKVLVAGGYDSGYPLSSAELYDPTAGTWSPTGNLNTARDAHTATLLNNGNILVVGGYLSWNSHTALSSAELYDPVAGTWSIVGNMNATRGMHTTTLLNTGAVLVAGGGLDVWGGLPLATAEVGTLLPANTFVGKMTLPSTWLNSSMINVQFSGNTFSGDINAGALSNDGNTWGDWISTLPDEAVATTWDVGGEGADIPIYLRLRDVNNQAATVVTGTVDVDLTQPSSSMTSLPSNSPADISLSWSGFDALSGVSTYDVQVRVGLGGTWVNFLSNTTDTSANYAGVNAAEYFFRIRASDVAGNMEDWPADYDTSTIVDTDPPGGTVVINSGAANTNNINVTLTLSASSSGSAVSQMSFSNNGSAWSAWESYATSKTWPLAVGDGNKTVYVRYKDTLGNVSANALDTITLDTVAPTGSVVIESGKSYTSSTSVGLALNATDITSGLAQMSFSNNGSTWSTWENYSTSKTWDLVAGNGNKTVYTRYKDFAGNISDTVNDTILLDVTSPISSMTPLSSFTGNAIIPLSWSGSDALSGVSTYDVQVRVGLGGSWINVLSNTTDTSANYIGTNGTEYYFRARANDMAGNLEAWPASYDTYTVVDTDAQSGTVMINNNAAYTNNPNITLSLSASDSGSGVSQMSFSNDGTTWSAWHAYQASTGWSLIASDGLQTIYVRFKDAVGNISPNATDTITLDTLASSGSVIIADTAIYSASTNVTLTLNASDVTSGVALMSFSNDGSAWSTWENYSTSKTWELATGDGSKIVYARYKDFAGNISGSASDAIILDTTLPTSSMTSLPSFMGSTSVPLSWSGSDSLSGISSYDLQAKAESDSLWTNVLTNTVQTSYSFSGIEGKTYYFRVRAKDVAGNAEVWREPYDTSTVGTDYGMTINTGALFTNSTDVVLTIAGKPLTSQMQIANDGGFAGAVWEPYTSHKNWQIIQYGSYVIPRVVYVRYKELNGTVSATYQDDIILDVTPPTGTVDIVGSVGLQALASTVTLSLNATDDVSGVGKMMISNQADFAGAVWENYVTSRVWTRASNTTVYVKFRDNAGNESALKTTDVTPPTVLSSMRVTPSPTNLASVQFTVTFSEPVTGVDTVTPFADFSLTTTGVTGASVTGVAPISGTTYTVTVNTGSGNGTLRLDLVDDNSIVDTASNPLGGAALRDGDFTASQTYDIQKPTSLTVSKAGTGSGTVTSSPIGINCGVTCSYAFAYNTVVTITADPTSPSTFGGWSGAGCSGTGT